MTTLLEHGEAKVARSRASLALGAAGLLQLVLSAGAPSLAGGALSALLGLALLESARRGLTTAPLASLTALLALCLTVAVGLPPFPAGASAGTLALALVHAGLLRRWALSRPARPAALELMRQRPR